MPIADIHAAAQEVPVPDTLDLAIGHVQNLGTERVEYPFATNKIRLRGHRCDDTVRESEHSLVQNLVKLADLFVLGPILEMFSDAFDCASYL